MKVLSAIEAEQSAVSALLMTSMAEQEREEELAKLVERPDKTFTAYSKEISAEKTKLMTNNTSGINKEIKIWEIGYEYESEVAI